MADKILKARIQLKTATAAEWSASGYVLLKGEIGIESDTRKFKIGTGLEGATWNTLEYANITDLSNYYSRDEIDGIIQVVNDSITTLTTKTQEDLDKKLNANLKGVANGVAELDENQKVKSNQLPDYILGQVLFGGTVRYDDGEGSPIANLSNSAKNKLGTNLLSITLSNDGTDVTGYKANEGIFYITTQNFNFAGIDFVVGDWLISTGLEWTKIDNTDAVITVNGRTGNVVITKEDVGLGNVENVTAYSTSVVDQKFENVNGQISENTGAIGNIITNVVPGLEQQIENSKYTLLAATSSKLGGVKIGFTTNDANRNYAVQLESEKMYVNVPWEAYNNATTSEAGLMSATDKTNLNNLNETAVVDGDTIIIDCGGATE